MEHLPNWAAEAVAAFLREQSAWREAQAHRFPNDDRNRRSARALAELADHVETLSDDDLALKELTDAGAFDERRRFVASEEARRVVARFGFESVTTPRALLQELARTTWHGRRRPAQKRNEMNATITAGEHVLTANDRSTLEDIFTIAETHSRRCRAHEGAYLASIDRGDHFASDDRGAWLTSVRNLHASIAPAAVARVRAFGSLDLDGRLLALSGPELERFLRPLFIDAGIDYDFVSDVPPTVRAAPREHEPTLAFRREIARLLTEVLERIRLIERVGATPKHLHDLEQTLLNARDNVEPIPDYAVRLEDAIRCVRALASGGNPLELIGQMRSALKTVLDNVVPEDRIDSGTEWERRESLQQVITAANAGDAWAIDVLKARPHVAFLDAASKKWVEQVDSGRGPGIAAARDHIIRTRRD